MKTKNFYILLTIVITLYSPAACRKSTNVESEASESQKPNIEETLARAERLFDEREDVSKLREALNLVSQIRGADHSNFEVEWRFAKYSYFLGQKLPDETEREGVLETGRDAGKIASRLQPDRPEGYFWYGANLGELSKLSPITVGLTSVDDIREAMNKVIELDPGYQGASAYDALGQIELRGFGGKPEKAVVYLEKGLEIKKNNSNIRLHLAKAYLSVDKENLAKQQLEYIVRMTPDPRYVPEHKIALEQAKKLLASRF